MNIYYDYIFLDGINYLLAATDEGMILLEGNGDLQKLVERWPTAELIPDDSRLKVSKEQLIEYFSGERTVFDLPLDLKGTMFQRKVWQALLAIPYGQTTTYQKLAESINRPKAIRAVGTAVGKNPIPIIIPCHRVLRTDGKLGGYSGIGGVDMKKHLLSIEKTIS